jgi:5'-3' exonuclease
MTQKTYVHIDGLNMFMRCKHVASRNSDTWEKLGMSIHMTLASVNQAARRFGADHVVYAFEGRSWRKDVYYPYKRNRLAKAEALTEAEVEENKLYMETYSDFVEFLREKTNISVLRAEQGEADDIIARFIQLHPNDKHVIISTDGDYFQLISENVSQYNGVTGEFITIDGYFNDKDKPILDKKTKQQKKLGETSFMLFEKCMRGDAGDNVFSAYPGVRTKGTKNKVGLIEAFTDKDKKGFDWNNMMLQKWTDHEGVEHRVKDDYERNCLLIDLSRQPDNIKQHLDKSINEGLNRTQKPQVGFHLLKFAGKYELNKVTQNAETYLKWLNLPYKGDLNVG